MQLEIERRIERHGRLIFAVAAFAFCCLHGAKALRYGQDINGDQLYYHFYAPCAFLYGRNGFDIAAGGTSGYNNPLIYLPFYFLATYTPARFTGFCLGFWEGLNFVLVFAIALHTFRDRPLRWRVVLSVAAVAFCLVGPMYSLELGRTLADDWATVPFLAGIWLILHGRSWGGILVGIACALKMTNALFAVALLISFALTRLSLRRFLVTTLSVASGFLIADGYWLFHEYRLFGNPLFPYFNGIFKSPFFSPINWHDTHWHFDGVRDLVTLPYVFLDSMDKVAEDRYRDSFWMLLVIVLLPYLVFRLVRRERVVKSALFLLIFTVIGFVLWAVEFHYARYMFIVSVIAPVIVVFMVRHMVRSDWAACTILALAVWGVARTSHYLPMDWARIPWGQNWYAVDDLGIPDESTVVLGNGIGSLAYRFPTSARLIGLGTNFFFSGVPATGSTPATLSAIHQALWSHPDRVYHADLETLPAAFKPDQIYPLFGFALDVDRCRRVHSNLGTLRVCQLWPVAKGEPPTALPD